MQHSEWFNRASVRKTKRVQGIKNGIKTYEWLDQEEPAPEATVKEEPNFDYLLKRGQKSVVPNTGKFHKADCSTCKKTTWHFRESGIALAHCCDCAPKHDADVKDAITMIAQLTPVAEAPTEGQIRQQNRLDRSLWRNAEVVKTRVYIDGDWGVERDVTADKPLDVDHNTCSFCNKPIDQIHTTSEKTAKIFKRLTPVRIAGEVVVEEQIMRKIQEVHACPNCIVNIRKPIIVRRV
jgi:hypothetical protein